MTVAERRALVAELRAQGLTLPEIATELGVSYGTVKLDARVLGLPPRCARPRCRTAAGASALLRELAQRGLAPEALPVAAALVRTLDEDAAA